MIAFGQKVKRRSSGIGFKRALEVRTGEDVGL